VKILADSCVWSLMLRRRKAAVLNSEEQSIHERLAEAIQDGRVVMIGPVRQEILSGIQHQDQFEKLRAALGAFPDVELATPVYEEAARLFNLCRSRGVECGATDFLICAIAIAEKWSILTNDRGLMRCIETLRFEGLSL
jgi:predicted nucleic acid-binding protein